VGFAAGVAGVVVVVAVRAPSVRADTFATAAARAAVAAFRVAALAEAAPAVAAFTVAVFAVTALALAAFTVAAFAVTALADAALVVAAALVLAAALARAASVPPADAAVLLREGRGVETGETGVETGMEPSAVVGTDPARFAFPWRCVGTVLVAFSSAGRRAVPRAEARVDSEPATGAGPSTRRWSWWSEFMHLTSVGRHCTRTPGERSGTHVNTP
jgi:hypothetical protein